MSANVLDKDGQTLTPLMGCYGMGVTRLVAAIIEQNHDDKGIVWPDPVAPFQVHILPLNYDKSDEVRAAADELYQACAASGIEVLLDDRNERPGVKFADADLIGIPHRVVIGDRGLKKGVFEYKLRADGESVEVEREHILERLTG